MTCVLGELQLRRRQQKTIDLRRSPMKVISQVHTVFQAFLIITPTQLPFRFLYAPKNTPPPNNMPKPGGRRKKKGSRQHHLERLGLGEMHSIKARVEQGRRLQLETRPTPVVATDLAAHSADSTDDGACPPRCADSGDGNERGTMAPVVSVRHDKEGVRRQSKAARKAARRAERRHLRRFGVPKLTACRLTAHVQSTTGGGEETEDDNQSTDFAEAATASTNTNAVPAQPTRHFALTQSAKRLLDLETVQTVLKHGQRHGDRVSFGGVTVVQPLGEAKVVTAWGVPHPEETVDIERHLVGTVIGRKGWVIKRIQKRTGCTMTVQDGRVFIGPGKISEAKAIVSAIGKPKEVTCPSARLPFVVAAGGRGGHWHLAYSRRCDSADTTICVTAHVLPSEPETVDNAVQRRDDAVSYIQMICRASMVEFPLRGCDSAMLRVFVTDRRLLKPLWGAVDGRCEGEQGFILFDSQAKADAFRASVAVSGTIGAKLVEDVSNADRVATVKVKPALRRLLIEDNILKWLQRFSRCTIRTAGQGVVVMSGDNVSFARQLVEAIAVPFAVTVADQRLPAPKKLKRALSALRAKWKVHIDTTTRDDNTTTFRVRSIVPILDPQRAKSAVERRDKAITGLRLLMSDGSAEKDEGEDL